MSGRLSAQSCPQGPQAVGFLERSRLWTCGQPSLLTINTVAALTGFSEWLTNKKFPTPSRRTRLPRGQAAVGLHQGAISRPGQESGAGANHVRPRQPLPSPALTAPGRSEVLPVTRLRENSNASERPERPTTCCPVAFPSCKWLTGISNGGPVKTCAELP